MAWKRQESAGRRRDRYGTASPSWSVEKREKSVSHLGLGARYSRKPCAIRPRPFSTAESTREKTGRGKELVIGPGRERVCVRVRVYRSKKGGDLMRWLDGADLCQPCKSTSWAPKSVLLVGRCCRPAHAAVQ